MINGICHFHKNSRWRSKNWKSQKNSKGPRGVVLSTLGYKICPKTLYLLPFSYHFHQNSKMAAKTWKSKNFLVFKINDIWGNTSNKILGKSLTGNNVFTHYDCILTTNSSPWLTSCSWGSCRVGNEPSTAR